VIDILQRRLRVSRDIVMLGRDPQLTEHRPIGRSVTLACSDSWRILTMYTANRASFLLSPPPSESADSFANVGICSASTRHHRGCKPCGELSELRRSESDAARRIDLLNYQINEIEAAHPSRRRTRAQGRTRNRLANEVHHHPESLLDEGSMLPYHRYVRPNGSRMNSGAPTPPIDA
jgi:hypothetical protein